MTKPEQTDTKANLSPAQETLSQLWEEHVRHEFSTRHTEHTLGTMVEDAYVNHIPVLTGGVGKDALREFYSKRFIPHMPADTEMIPISRTIAPRSVRRVRSSGSVDNSVCSVENVPSAIAFD